MQGTNPLANVRRSKLVAIFCVAFLAMSAAVNAQPVNPVVFDANFFVQVDAGTEKFCALSSYLTPISGVEKIQASASLTVTAVSGTPFDVVAAGDQLLVTNSDGTPYRLTVATKSSSTSITVAGLDSAGAVLTTLTLTSASFRWRQNTCGTGIDSGVIDVSKIRNKVLTAYISANSQDGNFQMRVQCRTGPGVPWSQVVPVLTPPAITATYNGYATGVLGLFTSTTIDGYGQCRVGFSFSSTDTGAADYASVSISGIS